MYYTHIGACIQRVGHAAAFGSILLCGPRTESLRKRAAVIMNRQSFRQRREMRAVINNSSNADTHSSSKYSSDACPGAQRPKKPRLDYDIVECTNTITASNSIDGTDTRARTSSCTNPIRENSLIPEGDPLVSVSDLGHGASIVRFAAHSTEDAYHLLFEILRPVADEGGLQIASQQQLPQQPQQQQQQQQLPSPYADRIHGSNPGIQQKSGVIAALRAFDENHRS